MLDFVETWIISTHFPKILLYQITWKLVLWKRSYSKRTHGQMADTARQLVTLHNFGNAPKNTRVHTALQRARSTTWKKLNLHQSSLHFTLFYFIYFILFYFILFYFILFYFILFYFILFYFILFYFILFYFPYVHVNTSTHFSRADRSCISSSWLTLLRGLWLELS